MSDIMYQYQEYGLRTRALAAQGKRSQPSSVLLCSVRNTDFPLPCYTISLSHTRIQQITGNLKAWRVVYVRLFPVSHAAVRRPALNKGCYRATFPQNLKCCCVFSRETEAGKTGNTFSKVWKINRGKNVWKASHSNIWKKKKWKHGHTHGHT